MLLYYAPMEGVTTYPYRNVHAACFPGVDKYFAPFIAPDGDGHFRKNALRDLLPENNRGVTLVPQILCNKAEAFLSVARELRAMGYSEVNLNAGCPSATVVPKHKGAGMLADLRSFDDFLAEVFSRCPLRVSVKTRIGLNSGEEFPAILEIYNKYPLDELIVHARSRAGMYKSPPDHVVFAAAVRSSRAALCYNGNVVGPDAYAKIMSTTTELDRIMIGRGAAADPALFRVLRGGERLDAEELADFLDRLLDAALSSGLPEPFALARMKELWYYLIHKFPDSVRSLKAIQKARRLDDYRVAVTALFAAGRFSPDACFDG